MNYWSVKKPTDKTNSTVAELISLGLPKIVAEVLLARGIETAAEVEKFLNGGELQDPLALKDMGTAVEIINAAVDNGEKICIYGDYDVDGITATYVLYSFLQSMDADVCYYIPERSEGYGMNTDSVKKLVEQGVKLIITVDNGVSAFAEAELIYELGMKLIITDHHQVQKEENYVGEVVQKLPKSEAVLNPHRLDCPSFYKNLCGAGVALKLVAALLDGDNISALEMYADFVSIATVCDIVELKSENRYIVSQGLQYIQNTENIGLIELMKVCGVYSKKLNSVDYGFKLGPHINSAGRFASPLQALELFLEENPESAHEKALELHRLNNERKETEQNILDEIRVQIANSPQLLHRRVLVFAGENWHHGVIGLIAQKIMGIFGKPTFIISKEKEIARGSARAFGEFSVFKALQSCEELCTKWGGHMSAGGFSLNLENIEKFTENLQNFALQNHNNMLKYTLEIAKILDPKEITVSSVKNMELLEPFGEGNPQPLFLIHGALVKSVTGSRDNKHSFINVVYGGIFQRLSLFFTAPENTNLEIGKSYDFLVTISVNEYNGKEQVNLIVEDYRFSGIKQNRYFAAADAYEKYLRQEELPSEFYARMLPTRNELIQVYKYLPNYEIAVETVFAKIVTENFNYCKLRIALDIFIELGLISYDAYKSTVIIHKNNQKVDLQSSKILQDLTKKVSQERVPAESLQ